MRGLAARDRVRRTPVIGMPRMIDRMRRLRPAIGREDPDRDNCPAAPTGATDQARGCRAAGRSEPTPDTETDYSPLCFSSIAPTVVSAFELSAPVPTP